MTLLFVGVGIVLFLAAAFFVGNHKRAKWMGETGRYLFRLNVMAPELPEVAASRFYSQGFEVYRASKGKADPQVFAIGFFTWFVTAYPHPKLSTAINEHPLEASLLQLRTWAEEKSPAVRDAAADAYNELCAFVRRKGQELEAAE